MSDNPIQYTSRTYTSILQDINAETDLRDTPEWWKRLWAGVGDVMSMMINATANNTYLRTAFTRQAVLDIAAILDYKVGGRAASSGNLLYDIAFDEVLPFSFAVGDQVATYQATTNTLRFEGLSASLIDASFTSVTLVDFAIDEITTVGDYDEGTKVRWSTPGTPPSPLDQTTDYYLVKIANNRFKLAKSRSDIAKAEYITLTDAGSGAQNLQILSRSLPVSQSTTSPAISVGTSNGGAWQTFQLRDIGAIESTITVTINGVQWTAVDTFLNTTAADNVFRALYNTDGSAQIEFADGVYGAIPTAGFDIFVSYRYTEGLSGNVSGQGVITIYAGGDGRIKGVWNPESMTGGDNEESIEQIKRLAPQSLKSRDRFVTTEDGEFLATGYEGILIARVNPNVYGPLSAQVLTIANGGGNPAPSVQSDLDDYLTERSVLESVDVRVEDTVITPINVTSTVKVKEGQSFVLLEPYVILGFRLFFSEVGQEVQDIYEAEGVAQAILYINNKWGTSFSASDYAQVQILVESLEPQQIGNVRQESDAFTYVQGSIDGIDYMTITAPAFPVTVGIDEITTDGVINVTEIP